MFRPLELFVGLRYTRARRGNFFISFISLISMLGIAVGVMALITVLSVMNGFEKEIRERILGMVSHATIHAVGEPMTNWRPVTEKARAHPEVVGAAPFVSGETLMRGYGIHGGLIRGIRPELEPEVSEIDEHLVMGRLDDLQPKRFRIILGAELARALGVTAGDKVTVYAPQLRSTPAGVIPQVRRFTVSGIFEAGVHQYDSKLAVVHMADAGRLFRMNEGVSGVRLKLDDMFQAWSVASEVAQDLDALGSRYRVEDWTQRHANFFRAVRTEKVVMFVILSLIVGVAAFNIVSTLVMVVTDKRADIAILRTLGLAPSRVMTIFIVQGVVIGAVGTMLGLIGGVSLALNVETIVPALERMLGMEFLPSDVYYISDLPSDLHWSDVWVIGGLAFVLAALATLYPAWRAARTQPAEALRYE